MNTNVTALPIATYRDHAIVLNQSQRFEVARGEHADDRKSFASFDEAKEYIDRQFKKAATAERIAIDMKLDVLTRKGKPATVKGIHAKLGTLTFTDPVLSKSATQRHFDEKVYPSVVWLQEALQLEQELLTKLQAVHDKLAPYGISVSRVHAVGSDEHLQRLVDELKRQHAEKLAKAKEKQS